MMIHVYKTEKEANKNFDAFVDTWLKKTCPVFKDVCLCMKCHSYIEPFVRKREYKYVQPVQDWQVREPGCTCAFVTGYIEAELNQ